MTTEPVPIPTTNEPAPAEPVEGPVEYDTTRVLTVPNVITVVRMCGSGVLIWLAAAGHGRTFVGLFVALALTDWIDGKVAVIFHQRSVLGARLDSFADVVLYICLLIGTAWARPDFVRAEAIFIAAMLLSYAMPVIATLVRFDRLPAYHTRAAKTCWFLAACATMVLLLDGPMWPARVMMIAVVITNFEALAIALVLPKWETDVGTLWHVLRRLKKK